MFQSTVELYRTIEKANAVARCNARDGAASIAGPSSLGCRRTTAAALTAELWELWGDGRVLVEGAQRSLIVAELMDGQNTLVASPGTVDLLSRFFARYGSALKRACPDAVPLTDRERAVLELGRRYEARLAEAGLVESDEAAFLLAGAVAAGAVPCLAVSAVDPVDAGPGLAALLRCFGCGEGARAAGSAPSVLPSLPAGVCPRFLVPAGPTAAAALVHDEIGTALEAGEHAVLVVAPDPRPLYDALAPALAADGAACALRCPVAFDRTWFGRALAAVERVASQARPVAAATDFAYNPLAAVGARDARRLNGALRADRLIDGAAMAERLSDLSPTFASFATLAAGSDAGFQERARALDAIGAHLRGATGLSVVARSCESAAAAALATALDAAAALGCAPASALGLARQATVPVSALSPSVPGAPSVEFAALARLGSLVPDSYDAVILADLTDAAFPAASRATALDELAEKLGLPERGAALDEQRRRFAAAMGAARARFACVVPQRQASGEEAYPAFVLKEYAARLAEAGRARALADGDGAAARAWSETDRDLFDLPVPLAADAICRGEDDLVAGLGETYAPVTGGLALANPVRGCLDRLALVDFLRTVREEGRRLVVLSPSALELYLGCPYAWFVQRRLRPSAPDEAFGPLEKGSFVHGVFARFYDRLADEGIVRVVPEQWAHCETVLAEVVDAELGRQRTLEAGEGRLLPLSRAERLEVERLRDQIAESLRRQSRFAPSYAVHGHERPIAVEDAVDYAGVRVNGRVDRIDVDRDAGRFTVVDYKGAVGAPYAAAMDEDAVVPPVPGRVQALVYAQALRPALEGLHCAGALYLGYRARTDKDLVAGAADGAVFEDDPFVKGASLVPMNFEAYLDTVESQIAAALEGLYRGEIAPAPRGAWVCEHCPVPNCERRLS